MSLVEILGLKNIVNTLDSTNFLISYLGEETEKLIEIRLFLENVLNIVCLNLLIYISL